MNQISRLGIFTLLLTSSLTIMVGTVIAPSLNEISLHLGFKENPGWLITLPSLGVVLFAPFAGKLIDKKGAYMMLKWGLIPYAILGFGGAFLNNPYLVILDRILLGAATALIQASATGLIAILFSGKERMKLIAWQGMAIELGGVTFLSIGGVLGELGWKYPFVIYLLGLICSTLLSISIKKDKTHYKELENPIENTNQNKLSKSLICILLFSTLAMILFFVAFVSLPLYLPSLFNYSESETGYFLAYISLIAVLSASQMPNFVKRTSNLLTLSLGFLAFTAGLFCFFISASNTTLFIGGLTMGIGFGFTVPLLNHMTIEESNTQNMGKNLSYYSMAIFGGQFLSSFITQISTEVRFTLLSATIISACTTILLLIMTTKYNK
ncbi:MFS transporter [Myroides sp. N17-2]|uniref:MFS transporter n=1 Tax=Myroides sp. N17-2 TaxID=2030799 RepID=UPI000EFC6A73|nr:MFS transporter [Myroides sp. N17-2]